MGGKLPPYVAAARNAVQASLSSFCGSSVSGPAYVACSGGADSLALAAAAGFLVRRRGLNIGAVVVDHGLLPGSDAVAAKAAEQCRFLGLSPVHVLRAHVSGNLNEGDARDARYAAIDEFLPANVPVLLAHTQNDQAEQVFLGLARGSGTRALAGIPPVRGRYLRPFLGLSRADTEAICKHEGLDFWTDPTNLETDALRNKVRLEVLPALAETFSDLTGQLARTAELARDDADYLDVLAEEALWNRVAVDPSVRDSVAFDATRTLDTLELWVDALQELPRALSSRVIRQAAVMVGGKAPDFERTRAVLGLLQLGPSTGPVQLDGQVNVIRTTLTPRKLVFASVRSSSAR